MKIILEKERPISWNDLYKGSHWSKRKNIAADVHKTVRYTLISMGIRPQKLANLFEKKVNITVNAYFDKDPLDSDNIPAKIYIDGLKEMLIRDDRNKYVGKVSTESFVDKSNPRLEMIIEEA